MQTLNKIKKIKKAVKNRIVLCMILAQKT
jgi:hypothetical protein